MNILISGGAGFIGSWLCDFFIKKNCLVICVDNFITSSKDNIKHLLKNSKFKLIEHDISKPLFIDQPLDWVLHFASIASPKNYIAEPIKTLKSGLLGTHNCLGIARNKGAKFLLASTSEIYGDPQVHPQPESYWGNVNPIGLRSCYDESKRAAEALTYAYYRQHKVSVRVVRIFNTYGPGMQPDDGRVISNFIVQALQGKPITVYGEGKQSRSFCYIEDLIKGIEKLIKVEYYLPVNLGNPREYKIIELAKIIIKLANSSSKIKYLPLMEDDPKRRQPDITVAKKILNWKPKVELKTGLLKTIKYFKDKIFSCE
ncbi:MAG: SDR family oxidoreductase [Candidatus Omnitrophica bacterium]|nr:SDR family oxidoreductase [Candidatus Omnitrophota bacterium]